tara:strand:- start:247 stop:1149 length:903 start_codon:yes stop_codon:yes gene_type:complete
MITLIQGEKKRFDIQGQSIKGLQFDTISIKSTSAADAFANLGAVDVSIVLYQGGTETTLCSGSLLPLVMASGFKNGHFLSAQGVAGLTTLVPTAGSMATLQPTSIDFGGVINLRGNDKMTVEVRCNTGFCTANQNAGSSNMTVSAVEGIGLQWVTPKIQYQTIGNGESNFRQNIGDNVVSIHYINTSITTDTATAQPITNIRLFSDRYNVNDSNNQLISKRGAQFETTGDSGLRKSSFEILDREVDDCRVELDLNPNNVATGVNYVVWRTFSTGLGQVKRAKKSRSKHQAKAMGKVSRNR